MAEIKIERKKRNRWPLVLLLILLIIVVAWLVYEFTAAPGDAPVEQILEVLMPTFYQLFW